MLTFLAEENLDGTLVRGLRRRRATTDIVRVQDIGLSGQDDPAVLERAAGLNRVLLTHDAATIPEFAFARIGAGLPMPGVIIVRRSLAVGAAIEDILLVDELTAPTEMDGQILYLPL